MTDERIIVVEIFIICDDRNERFCHFLCPHIYRHLNDCYRCSIFGILNLGNEEYRPLRDDKCRNAPSREKR